MASLWKHPRSRFWTACFSAADGRQLKRSTKTTDRRLAMRLADEFESAARNLRTARQTRKVISELHSQITGDSLSSKTLRQYVDEWIARKEPETSPATMKFYRYCTATYLKWLGTDADRDIGSVGRERIIHFRNDQAKTLAVKTVNHNLKCIKMVYRSAKRDGLISEDHSEHVACIRARDRSNTEGRRAFTLDELRLVLSHCDKEWRSMVLFGFYTGQRLGDIARLLWRQIDLRTGILRLTTGKTGRRMQIPLAKPLLVMLKRSWEGEGQLDGPVHPTAYTIAEKNGTGHLSGIFSRILVAAGLRPKQHHGATGEPRKQHQLSFHSLRYTATTTLQSAGVAAGITQEFIGHDSEAIHQHYARFGLDSLEKAAALLPDLTK